MDKKNQKQMPPPKEEKVTNENPVSLSPLRFKEALAALLKVKPTPKEEKTEEKKEERADN